MKQIFGLFVVCAFSTLSYAQFGFIRANDISVSIAGDTLKSAWGGGLNCPQFSEIDINFDGITDLFVLDRSSDQIRIFVGTTDGIDTFFVENSDYRSIFPDDVRYRAVLVDYNKDGLPDIFTYGIGGVQVYVNVGNASIGHKWIVKEKLLYSDQYGTLGNLYVSSADVPAIVDVDGDGDIDVLTYHIDGQRVEYHKNMSMEAYGIPDSLDYILVNECWGQFRESSLSNLITIHDTISPCAHSNFSNPELPVTTTQNEKPEHVNPPDKTPEKHSGSTILALDLDNSSTLDLIIGDVTYPSLVMLLNGGTAPNTNSSMDSLDPTYPSYSVPANVDVFPAAYSVDADFDSVKDMLVSPNAIVTSDDRYSVWKYKNVGTNTYPSFIFQETNFLQKDMIEVGTGSIPIFVDANEDGLLDLLVSNFYHFVPPAGSESNLTYYENTGTANAPHFTFVDDDKFGMLSSGLGLRMIPSFGDLDNDGDLDMIVGDESGTLTYFSNNAGNGNPLAFDAPQLNMTDNMGAIIDIGAYASPLLIDLDEDGLLDLVIGTKKGTLFYYQNVGSQTNYAFKLIDNNFGGVNVSPSSPEGYSVPFFTKTSDGWQLFVGAQDGKLHFYNQIEGNLSTGAIFTKVSDNYLGIDVSQYSSFSTLDIDGDGNLELFVGEDLGGIEYFKADPSSTLGIKENKPQILINVYPNPAKQNVTISGCKTGNQIVVCNSLGQIMINETVLYQEKTGYVMNVSSLENGVYFLSIKGNEQVVQKTLVIVR